MFRFAHSEVLYILLLIPLLLAVYIILFRDYRAAIAKFGSDSILGVLMPDRAPARRHIKFTLLLLILSLIIVALARPQFGSKLEEIKREGIEIVLALDVSNSMRAEDIKPSRLERAKQAIVSLIEKLDNDRIGLIVFAGDAYTQIPLTTDYVSARMFLSNTSTDIVSKQGTAIGSAIELGMKSFSPNTEASKVIVIISDGENHEGNAIQAAQQAAEKGIKIFTIGMGFKDGAPIPNLREGGFVKDRQGKVVMSKMNPEMLTQIAATGGGDYFTASTSNVGLTRLYNQLNKMQKAKLETKVYSEYDDQYQYFIGLALLLMLIEFLISERKAKWIKEVQVFGSKKMD